MGLHDLVRALSFRLWAASNFVTFVSIGPRLLGLKSPFFVRISTRDFLLLPGVLNYLTIYSRQEWKSKARCMLTAGSTSSNNRYLYTNNDRWGTMSMRPDNRATEMPENDKTTTSSLAKGKPPHKADLQSCFNPASSSHCPQALSTFASKFSCGRTSTSLISSCRIFCI